MDPNANLKEQVKLATLLVDDENASDDATRLAELVLSLDEWIRKGGFLPQAWGKR